MLMTGYNIPWDRGIKGLQGRQAPLLKLIGNSMEKTVKPIPISEAERQWCDEQGNYGNCCFAFSDDSPTNNVFSLDYYRSMTCRIPRLELDQEEDKT